MVNPSTPVLDLKKNENENAQNPVDSAVKMTRNQWDRGDLMSFSGF
jgi:hypothetical protein